MCFPASLWLRLQVILAVFFLFSSALLRGQNGYHISQYTSKEGLPQNSIRGLAFDQHGFLWLATEGGIARFDGQSFKVIGARDHPLIRNQRFTHAIPCKDQSIIFTDMLNGMYLLAHDRFSTLREPDSKHPALLHIKGGLPDPHFLVRDSIFFKESQRTRAELQYVGIFPVEPGKVFMATDRTILLDISTGSLSVIDSMRTGKDHFAMIDNQLIKLGADGLFYIHRNETKKFEPCQVQMADDPEWNEPMKGAVLHSQYPFRDVFLHTGKKLYKLIPGKIKGQYTLHTLLDSIPDNCKITSVAYKTTENMLVLGTDTRGLFVYKPKFFNTYFLEEQKGAEKNVYYAQCLLDDTTLLTGNGWLMDLRKNKVKGFFDKPIDKILLSSDDQQNIYFSKGQGIFRYTPSTRKEILIRTSIESYPQCIVWMAGSIWIGTSTGVGRIIADSVHWVFNTSFSSDQNGITTITQDGEGNIWFASYFQLYRLNTLDQHIDSFPELANVNIRVVEMIQGKPFIGTYGNGYYVYHDGRFNQMPDGRNHELSNTHTFVEDREGHLWISTNRGLYKTHVDAIEAYLSDTTLSLDYYAYLEEDGIHNTEFNGGCSPPHLFLPDGRLSLPSIEGLVLFTPEHTPHYFSKDSMVIEYIEVDGIFFRPEAMDHIPTDHSNIRFHFTGSWWTKAFNQYVYHQMENTGEPYQLCGLNQTSLSVGHLKPGHHTFVLRRRCGFGPEDFVYSRFHFLVDKPWYAKSWAILLFLLGLTFITWATAVLNTRSIRKRNTALQQKVDEQTRKLLISNVQLEENVNKLALSETNLRKNIEVRDKLISIITHDILTPLRFIGQIARLGGEEKPSDEGLTKRALRDIQNAVHKLFHSTQNLLHWVKYHQEQFKISSITCSPFAIVEQLLDDFREMSRFQGNTLINQVPEDDIFVTDPRILNIILHNLISNAIKYTRDGEIRILSSQGHDWYTLEVRDTGRGMTASQLDLLRKGANNQVDVRQEDIAAGTGIGLSLVTDLVQILHGRWEIESPEGSGVRVKVHIPLTDKVGKD